MPRHNQSILTALALTIASSAFAQQHETASAVQEQAQNQPSAHWLDVQLKARSMLIDPADGVLHEVTDSLPEPMGIRSPDGKKVAYIGSDPQRVKDGHDFDLFVADVDVAQPSKKSNIRRLTESHIRPVAPVWLAESDGLAFLAQRSEEDAQHQAWFVDFTRDAKPILLSDPDALHVSQLSITPDGRIAFVQLNERKGKQQFSDLIERRPPGRPTRASEGGGGRTILKNQHVSSYAFSSDGTSLAWSGAGSMFIIDLATGDSREIPLHGIHRQLINHAAQHIAWRPDGKVIAIHCGFLGGIARGLNADPDEPWPRMFAEDKVFFVPMDWNPSPESLNVTNENFPSPTAGDAKAEVSPPAGDESQPWWIRELPMRPLEMKWITADEARNRLAPQQ